MGVEIGPTNNTLKVAKGSSTRKANKKSNNKIEKKCAICNCEIKDDSKMGMFGENAFLKMMSGAIPKTRDFNCYCNTCFLKQRSNYKFGLELLPSGEILEYR